MYLLLYSCLTPNGQFGLLTFHTIWKLSYLQSIGIILLIFMAARPPSCIFFYIVYCSMWDSFGFLKKKKKQQIELAWFVHIFNSEKCIKHYQ